MFEEKVQREQKRQLERDKERKEREEEIKRLKEAHHREIKQLKARFDMYEKNQRRFVNKPFNLLILITINDIFFLFSFLSDRAHVHHFILLQFPRISSAERENINVHWLSCSNK